MFLNEQTLSVVPSSASGFHAENASLQREFVVRASELPTLIQNEYEKRKKEEAKAGYKWRGRGWNVCDLALVQSFQHQSENSAKLVGEGKFL